MREVRIASYKASMQSWTDMVISGWTWIFNPFSKSYSHTEIGFLIDGVWKYFSSSIRDGGTRWKNGDRLLKNPERWDVCFKEYDDDAVERMVARAHEIENKRYDKLGIMGFATITGQVLNRKNAWYCSEACWYVLTGSWMKRISPRRLWKKISNVFNQLFPRGGQVNV